MVGNRLDRAKMADFMSNSLRQLFETALWNSRFVVLVTVVMFQALYWVMG